MSYETVRTEIRGRVALLTLDRPKALNALSAQVLADLTDAVAAFDGDDAVGAMVLTGSERAFAAGADIKEMTGLDFVQAVRGDYIAAWERFAATRKPVIAAVAGYALGGGCELAMMCDIIYAADTAKFGQPEITLGIIPGIGGTQRLIRAVGKAKAMDLILTGRMMDAAEAERSGLVARVFAPDVLLDEALAAAGRIAGFSPTAVLMAKEAVGRAHEIPLSEGLRYERRLFHALFATEDQKEGMAAFVEKRPPVFTGR
ncbi:enoyl-CoA hydratase [Chthonobacter rhizosphaerae]|uniref:enoyl-CoA hydratase n=1 Tax=Chthonobacter rhizosphaerae TaxID=2735553 RepID=UPI0015EEF0E9|nr:enoyl-CoA hydratase [Chthonobacter rhizosphaerae]